MSFSVVPEINIEQEYHIFTFELLLFREIHTAQRRWTVTIPSVPIEAEYPELTQHS